ncbi:MAG: alpha/beta hydrolase [bacterium]|nr:alpha/beta hydrolase [bacterium]
MRHARGFVELIPDVVEETTHLVERTHDASVERWARLFAWNEPAGSSARLIAGIQTTVSGSVFKSIRAVNGFTRFAVSSLADVAVAEDIQLAKPVGSSAAGTAGRYADYLQASLNGFWGDSLSRRKSRLALGMTLRHHGRHLPATPQALAAAFPRPTNKVCVFVHGLATTEWLWSRSSEELNGDPGVTFGTRLRDDLGFTPIYLRYNTGRHISENGRALATLLAELLEAYPVPVEEIALVGHSMGGLVARSAAHYARETREPWVAHLRHVACISSPHLGAPLEKAANLLAGVLRTVKVAGAQVPAELLDSRSAGVKDLRYGYTVDEEWAGKDPDEVFADARRNVPLVDGVRYYFLAATISRDPDHPIGRWLGDLLVRLPSASGEAHEPARRIRFSNGAVLSGMNHVRTAYHPEVYEALRDLLAA